MKKTVYLVAMWILILAVPYSISAAQLKDLHSTPDKVTIGGSKVDDKGGAGSTGKTVVVPKAADKGLTVRPESPGNSRQKTSRHPSTLKKGSALHPKIYFVKLMVQEHSGDFAKWVTTTTIDTMKTQPSYFKWKNPVDNVKFAHWQLSDVPMSDSDTTLDGPGTLKTGMCPVPGKIAERQFPINLAKYLPASPPEKPEKYYVRLRIQTMDNKIIISNRVTITYQKNLQKATEFTAKGLQQTVQQKYEWMYKNSPMDVEINLKKLHIGNSNEGSDEPYLLVAVIYADGTTINPLNFPASTVRVDCLGSAHGNLPEHDMNGDDLDTGATALIPGSTGHYHKSIKPIGLEFATDMPDYDGAIGKSMLDNTAVYIIVIAMEEDATSDGAANSARSVFCSELTNKLNAVIQGLTMADLKNGDVEFDPVAIQKEIEDKAIGAAEGATLTSTWMLMGPLGGAVLFAQITDPDDFVGASYRKFSFGDLLNAGKQGMPFNVNLHSSGDDWGGSYSIDGTIKWQ